MTYLTAQVGLGSNINSANELSDLLKNQPVAPPSQWDSFLGTTATPTNYQFLYTTSVPLTSPSYASSYYDDWDFCYDISSVGTTDFATFTTVNFGKARGTTQNATIEATPYGGIWTVRAYFKVELYPFGGTFYQSQYSPLAKFILDNLII